jgi:ribose/xylose/arabinose/galactoside ABC-type transport system permease subunit
MYTSTLDRVLSATLGGTDLKAIRHGVKGVMVGLKILFVTRRILAKLAEGLWRLLSLESLKQTKI